jgi:hypothetical protein
VRRRNVTNGHRQPPPGNEGKIARVKARRKLTFADVISCHECEGELAAAAIFLRAVTTVSPQNAGRTLAESSCLTGKPNDLIRASENQQIQILC